MEAGLSREVAGAKGPRTGSSLPLTGYGMGSTALSLDFHFLSFKMRTGRASDS